MSETERPPTTEELQALAEALGRTFIQRRDLYARQLDDGSYISVKKPLRPGYLKDHLLGKMTLGAYVLDQDSSGRFMVLDADNDPDWRRLQALASALAEMGDSSYLEGSRRGGHLWMFFAEPMPATDIRRFGQGLLDYFRIENIELFPKQPQLTSGPGSLIRLPFGVHRKSGGRYGFYLPDGQPLAPTLREQIAALGAPETLSKPVLDRFWDYVTETDRKAPQGPSEVPQRSRLLMDDDAPVSERIKNAITVRQFVLQYVELSKRGMGLCPFHDDHNPSFAVNDSGNYWKCFAGCGGGSVIDFYMLYQQQVMGKKCDFSDALTELADILLRQYDVYPDATPTDLDDRY
ncbi:MAG TPA: CHC2 zinc finger domain-containing protein [Dehalococcoidia bacterium]|nr:CHC2 zinc finger domain-containing protein [Dehalococcoidia bacterium]